MVTSLFCCYSAQRYQQMLANRGRLEFTVPNPILEKHYYTGTYMPYLDLLLFLLGKTC
jgi:hypothetical protein